MSKNQFTGTATQPQCNRKFCQFNKDQYWSLQLLWLRTLYRLLWSLATAAFHRCYVSLFYMWYTLLLLLLLLWYTYHTGITFIYTIFYLRVILGQVWSLTPLNLDETPSAIRHWPFQCGNSTFSQYLCMYHYLVCLTFYIFNLFDIFEYVHRLYFLFYSFCMLIHLHDFLFTLF